MVELALVGQYVQPGKFWQQMDCYNLSVKDSCLGPECPVNRQDSPVSRYNSAFAPEISSA